MTILIDIDHEAGNLGEYDSTTTDGGDLSVAAGAALAGTGYGLSCVIDDTNDIYGYATITASTTGVLRYRFYIDPNDLTIPTGNNFTVTYLSNSGYGQFCEVKLGYASSSYNLLFIAYNDAGDTSGTYNITNAPHYVEIYLTRATTSSSNDGYSRFGLMGVNKGQLLT